MKSGFRPKPTGAAKGLNHSMRTETKEGGRFPALALCLGETAAQTRKMAQSVRAFADTLEQEAQERLTQAQAQRDYATMLDSYADHATTLKGEVER